METARPTAHDGKVSQRREGTEGRKDLGQNNGRTYRLARAHKNVASYYEEHRENCAYVEELLQMEEFQRKESGIAEIEAKCFY